MEDSRTNNFIQIYQENVSILYGLNGSELKLLLSMVKRMTYGYDRFNSVVITGGVKARISDEIKVSVGYINSIITGLIKKKLIVRMGSGDYMINPFVFWRGNLQSRQIAINAWNKWSK